MKRSARDHASLHQIGRGGRLADPDCIVARRRLPRTGLFVPDAQRVIAGGRVDGDCDRFALSRCKLDALETDQPLRGLLGAHRIGTGRQGQVNLDHFGTRACPGIGNPRAGAPGRAVSNLVKLWRIDLERRVRQAVSEGEGDAWIAAFEYLQTLRLAAQIDGHVIGGNPNAVAVEGLNSVDKTILRESLSEVRNLQQRLELDYVR